ncbi:MAG: hypothetical protein K2X38_07230 [Gemmataceae bacterium]|nr:hypothetical protein [Gemmataceae bacterium]
MNPPYRWTWRWALIASIAVAPGCANFWDDITARDFSVRNWWTQEDPIIVLHKSTDGWKRAKAIARLNNPKNQEEREQYFKILSTVALQGDAMLDDKIKNDQPMCRLAAITVLGQSKDARAPKILEDVYLQRLPYTPELAKVVRQQALAALEETGEANSRSLFIRVARQPGADATSATADHLQTLDERLAAIRALSKYSQPDVVETLVHLMESDRDVAIRSRAWDSLKTATKKDLPNDAKAWREMLATGKEPPRPSLIEKAAAWTPNLDMQRPQFLQRDKIQPKLTGGEKKKDETTRPFMKDAGTNPTPEATQTSNSSPGLLSKLNPFRREETDPAASPQPGPVRRLFQGQETK